MLDSATISTLAGERPWAYGSVDLEVQLLTELWLNCSWKLVDWIMLSLCVAFSRTLVLVVSRLNICATLACHELVLHSRAELSSLTVGERGGKVEHSACCTRFPFLAGFGSPVKARGASRGNICVHTTAHGPVYTTALWIWWGSSYLQGIL